MARGKNNRGRGGFQGFSDNGDFFRARGRGGWRGGRGNGRGRGRGRGGPAYMDEFDMPIQQWPSNNPPTPPSTRGTPRGRGRGRGSNNMPFNVYKNSRGGLGSPRGSGRGRGDAIDRSSSPYGGGRNLTSKLKAGAPLSRLLYEDRPFLRPIVFVRSVYTATLFENEEDIFQSVAEPAVDGVDESHVPTADAVFRVFHPLEKAPEKATEPSGDEAGGEQLEEIDFADIGKIQAQVDAAAAQKPTVTEVTTVKESSTSFFVDTTPSTVDLHRTNRIQVDRVNGGALGEADEDDDEVIVYVAPHPRKTKSSPSPTGPSPLSTETLPSTSILTGVEIGSASQQPALTIEMGPLYPNPEASRTPSPPPAKASPTIEAPAPEELPVPTFDSVSFSFNKTTVKKQTRRLHPVGAGTPRSLLKRNRKARRKSLRGFGAFGAMHEEAMLREEDPRRAEQRRGNSDVNFGTSDEEDDVDALSVDMGGMELDDGIDMAAMKRFVHSMSAEGSRHVTMDDVADIERMRLEDDEENVRGPESADEDEEDEEGEGAHAAGGPTIDAEANKPADGSDEEADAEVEVVVRAEERVLIGESADEDDEENAEDDDDDDDEDEDEDDEDDEDEDDSDSPDEDETPRRGFQARLERLRASSSKGKGKAKAEDYSDDDDAMSVQMTWADEDEEYFDQIEELLAENVHIFNSGSRRARKYMFKAIQNGDFDPDDDIYASMLQPAKRGKDKHVPPELREQWDKDRQKKAENKKKRALDRLMLAADPMASRKGGKKGRKAMLAAARAAEDLPNRIVDFVDLEQQIRRFLQDIGGPNTMTLPPCDKDTRKRVHELATAFNLKSQSKGKGEARYTTLTKKSNSGVGINEGKVRHIMRQATKGKWEAPGGYGKGKGKTSLAKHREGEEVGKDAARIDDKNVGFRMLAAMGWSDGDRIGLSGGLDAPLTAIMKKTKLGLGATL